VVKNFIKKRYYIISTVISLVCLWSAATVQSYLLYQSIELQNYIVPTLVGLIAGSLMGLLVSLRVSLRQTNKQFRAIADMAQEFIYLRQPDGVYTYVSPSCANVTGYSREEFYCQPNLMDKLIHEKDRERWANHVHDINDGGVPDSFDIRLYSKQGKIVWINHICMPVFDEQGIQTCVRSTNLDISHRKELEIKLNQASAVFDNTTEGIIITDVQGIVLGINQAFLQISGFSEQEIIGQTPRLWRSEHHDYSFYQAMWSSLIDTGHWQGEIWNRRKNGDVYPAWLTINPVKDKTDKLINYVAILNDISALKQSQERIEFLAHHDPLTKLPNRWLFNARLEHAMQRAVRENYKVAVLFLDLDNFKTINDGLGHPMGDKVIQNVASNLTSVLREQDTVARLGGDEFTIILEDIVNAEDIAQIINKIHFEFSQPMVIDNHELHVGVSIGISIYPDDASDVTSIVTNADTAMYRAKEEQKGGYCFYTSELTTVALERLQLENLLRKALMENQFLLYYQPQYCMSSGRLVGAEALLRWQSPELGLVTPDRFIPLAESTGLIVPIGDWVLQAACLQAQLWLDKGFAIERIGVNIAGQQIQQGNIVDKLREVLKTTSLSAQYLELEVTESFVMQQPETAISTLTKLKSMGVGLAIDDFGTGYSSLSYLKLFPINKLKIDRSFVKDIPNDDNSIAIVNAIIALGKSLQLKLIAEGVETEEQKIYIKEAGCEEVQGYLYSPPVDHETFSDLFK